MASQLQLRAYDFLRITGLRGKFKAVNYVLALSIAMPIIAELVIISDYRGLNLYLYIVLSILATLSFVFFVLSYLREFVDAYAGRSIAAIIFVYIVVSISVYFKESYTSLPGGEWDPVWIGRLIEANISNFIMSIVTILGFVITISTIRDMQNHIRDYETFLIRLESFLRNVIEDTIEDRGDAPRAQPDLRIMCTVPVLGNFSHPKEFYPSVYDLICRVARARSIKLEIICYDYDINQSDYDAIFDHLETRGNNIDYRRLDWSDSNSPVSRALDMLLDRGGSNIAKFYKEIEKQRSVPGERHNIRRALAQAIDVTRKFKTSNFDGFFGYDPNIIKMPAHMFITSTRAIVALPLDLHIRPQEYTDRVVALVGYETSDLKMIQKLNDTFAGHVDLINKYKSNLEKSASDAASAVAINVVSSNGVEGVGGLGNRAGTEGEPSVSGDVGGVEPLQ